MSISVATNEKGLRFIYLSIILRLLAAGLYLGFLLELKHTVSYNMYAQVNEFEFTCISNNITFIFK